MPATKWLDTHIHVSNFTPQGEPRGDILGELLAVMNRDGADLRFVISPDFPWVGRMTTDAAQVLEASRFIHDLVQRAPGKLYGACMVNPNFLDASLRAMEVCFGEWGFVMLGELLPYLMNHTMNSAPAERLVRLSLIHI